MLSSSGFVADKTQTRRLNYTTSEPISCPEKTYTLNINDNNSIAIYCSENAEFLITTAILDFKVDLSDVISGVARPKYLR